MKKKGVFLLCLALFNLHFSESKNVFSSFLSFVKSKLSSNKDMVKIIQLGNAFVCLANSENIKYNECACSFTKLKEFEKKCSSNLKTNQEEAKQCSEEKCEVCCKLEDKNESAISILEYELSCKKKCARSNLVFELNDDDNRLVFKKIIEFIRIFHPTTTLHYYPEQNKTVEYTGKKLNNKDGTITNDLSSQITNNTNKQSGHRSEKKEEESFSPHEED